MKIIFINLPSQNNWTVDPFDFKTSPMKQVVRLLVLLILAAFLAGTVSSCALFDKTSIRKQESFKQKKPLQKKWIIINHNTHNAK